MSTSNKLQKATLASTWSSLSKFKILEIKRRRIWNRSSLQQQIERLFSSGERWNLAEQARPPVDLPCRIDSFHDDQARCWALVADVLVPVDLPAEALRAQGLTEGMRFSWSFSGSGPIEKENIRPLPEPELSEERRQEIEALLDEAIAERAVFGRVAALEEADSAPHS